ncbi:tetraacyldisaccharide 4'-kinase [Mucilaginibacter humi]|uniref:tetraacyldisaccharide 4'-kinase n=1 Tax=Mucilaginibacter humi TaxID=2732510 RepID=UPI00293BC669|nr:tetraacyldisaccharide 4'-kinase [Mucilaginibacter humi]
MIIVSKCPADLPQEQLERIVNEIAPQPYQQMFFTSINYMELQDLGGKAVDTVIDDDTTVFLLTGIANARPLVSHIKKQTLHVIHHNYPDHHQFSLKNITKLADDFAACTSQKKVIITTEKDAQRLEEQELLPLVKKLPILVLPIGVSFLHHGQEFNEIVTDYVRKYREHYPVY